MYYWRVYYKMTFRGGGTWDRERVIRAGDITQAMQRAEEIAESKRRLPLVESVTLKAIIASGKEDRHGQGRAELIWTRRNA